jgi:hypothetical protein
VARVKYLGMSRAELISVFGGMKTWEPFLAGLTARYKPFSADYKALDAIHSAIKAAGAHFLEHDSPFDTLADVAPDAFPGDPSVRTPCPRGDPLRELARELYEADALFNQAQVGFPIEHFEDAEPAVQARWMNVARVAIASRPRA